MLSVERIDVFFLIGRRRSAAWDFFFLSLAISAQLTSSSSRLRTALRRGRHRWARAGTLAPTPAAAAASTAAAVAAPSEVAAAPAVVLRDLGGGEAQAGPDLVGDDLDDVSTVAVTVLVAALLEATGDDDA